MAGPGEEAGSVPGLIRMMSAGVRAISQHRINVIIALVLSMAAATAIYAFPESGEQVTEAAPAGAVVLKGYGNPGQLVTQLQDESAAAARRAAQEERQVRGGEHALSGDMRCFLARHTFADDGECGERPRPPAAAAQQPAPAAPQPAPAVPSAGQDELAQRRRQLLLQAIASPSSLGIGSGSLSVRAAGPVGSRLDGGSDRDGSGSHVGPLARADLAQSRSQGSGGRTASRSTGSLSEYARLRQDSYRHDSRVEGVDNPYLLRQGTVIPAVMLSGINSDLPGQILAQVTDDVLDTPVGEYVLIPRGARLVGQYGSSPEYGSARLMMAFNRIIFPDGKAMDIGAMPGTGTDGYSGADAHVNNHLLSIFTSSVLLAGVGTTVILTSQNDYNSDGEIKARSAFAQELSETLGTAATQIIQRNLNVSPTLEIYPGYAFNVSLIKDLRFDRPYEDYDDYVSP